MPTELRIADLERFNVAIEDLFASPLSNNLRLICPESMFWFLRASIDGEPPSSRLSALKTYDAVVASWISSLPTSAPILSRTKLSALASKVACEISLASTWSGQSLTSMSMGDRQSGILDGENRENLTEDQSLETSSANELSQRSMPDLESSSQDLTMSSSFPTRSPSLTSGSSYTSRGPNAADLAFERLSRLTNFEKQPTLRAGRLNQILAHWSMSDDPIGYNWSEVRRNFEADRGRTLNKKAERRVRRHLERQRREAERAARLEISIARRNSQSNSQIMQSRSSPPPQVPRFLGESRSLIEEAGSSQDPTRLPFVASQGERGVYGQRPRQPLKKRPRRAGF